MKKLLSTLLSAAVLTLPLAVISTPVAAQSMVQAPAAQAKPAKAKHVKKHVKVKTKAKAKPRHKSKTVAKRATNPALM
jgi:hypothetical protein